MVKRKERKLELPQLGSQAGAWEPGNPNNEHFQPVLRLIQQAKSLAFAVCASPNTLVAIVHIPDALVPDALVPKL